MTDDAQPPDVVDDETTDVLAEDEVVHVPPAVEDLADSQEAVSTFLPDVPDCGYTDASLQARYETYMAIGNLLAAQAASQTERLTLV